MADIKTTNFGDTVKWGLYDAIIVGAYKKRKYWYYVIVINDDDLGLSTNDWGQDTINCEVVREDRIEKMDSKINK